MIDIYCDSACRGNPGVASFAFVFVKDGSAFYEKKYFVGECATNNAAEWISVIEALQSAADAGYKRVNLFFSDSELAVSGKYSIKNPILRELRQKIAFLKADFDTVRFIHVYRNNQYIAMCNRFCNDALDLLQSEAG